MQAQCTDRLPDGSQRYRRVSFVDGTWLCEVLQATRASAASARAPSARPLAPRGDELFHAGRDRDRRRLETASAREAYEFLGGDETAQRLLREANAGFDPARELSA
jgi:hypothetical protein